MHQVNQYGQSQLLPNKTHLVIGTLNYSGILLSPF